MRLLLVRQSRQVIHAHSIKLRQTHHYPQRDFSFSGFVAGIGTGSHQDGSATWLWLKPFSSRSCRILSCKGISPFKFSGSLPQAGYCIFPAKSITGSGTKSGEKSQKKAGSAGQNACAPGFSMAFACLPGICDCFFAKLLLFPLPSSDQRGIFKGEKQVSQILAPFSPLNRLFFRLFLLATQKKEATRNHTKVDFEEKKWPYDFQLFLYRVLKKSGFRFAAVGPFRPVST